MNEMTQIIKQTGFHGRCIIPITGTNWRPWNEITVAVDMTAAQTAAMFDAASCTARDCQCGGYHTAQPAHTNDSPNSGTYLVPIEWVTNPDILARVVSTHPLAPRSDVYTSPKFSEEA